MANINLPVWTFWATLLYSFFLCALSNWIHCVFICKSIWAGQICKKMISTCYVSISNKMISPHLIKHKSIKMVWNWKKSRWISTISLLDCNPIFEVYFTSVTVVLLYTYLLISILLQVEFITWMYVQWEQSTCES